MVAWSLDVRHSLIRHKRRAKMLYTRSRWLTCHHTKPFIPPGKTVTNAFIHKAHIHPHTNAGEPQTRISISMFCSSTRPHIQRRCQKKQWHHLSLWTSQCNRPHQLYVYVKLLRCLSVSSYSRVSPSWKSSPQMPGGFLQPCSPCAKINI